MSPTPAAEGSGPARSPVADVLKTAYVVAVDAESNVWISVSGPKSQLIILGRDGKRRFIIE
jgi:hypothetical protein